MFDSPERKAALDKSLREAVKKIADPSIRSHYGEEIKQLRWQLFRAAKSSRRATSRAAFMAGKGAPLPTMASTKASYLGSAAASGAEEHLREAVILATLIANPGIVTQFESALEALDLSSVEHSALRSAILRHADAADFRERVIEDAGADTLEKLMSLSHVQITPAVRNPGDVEVAAMCVAQELAKLAARRGVEKEISDAVQEMGDVADEGITWRLTQAAEARNRAERSQTEDKTQYETGDNGARINREERTALNQLLDQIDFAKGARRSQE